MCARACVRACVRVCVCVCVPHQCPICVPFVYAFACVCFVSLPVCTCVDVRVRLSFKIIEKVLTTVGLYGSQGNLKQQK